MAKKLIILLILATINLASSPLAYLNSIREKSGASKLQYDKVLSNASMHHAKYVSANGEYSHYENSSGINYYASTPWLRIVKAGYKTKVIIENISFLEPSFKASIDKIMGTVYHRLAFLYPKVDKIGYASFNKIYVYDMSNSKIANLCSKHYKNAVMIIDRVCPNSRDIIPQTLFNKAMSKMLSRTKDVIIYPYKNQKGVPLKGVEETPKFLYEEFGFPITVIFNSNYYSNVRISEFKLLKNGNNVDTKVVSSANDINGKIRKDTFVLVPLNRLKSKTTYRVVLKFRSGSKVKKKEWSFTTR